MECKGRTAGKKKQIARLGTGVCVLCLVLLFCVPVRTQVSIPAPTPAVTQTESPKDPLDRMTPRGTVLGFLNAARKGDNELAAEYLNTRLHGSAATNLAHQLFVVLDRRLPARLNDISDKPEGSLSNPLKPDQEVAGTISTSDGNVDIILERVDRGRPGPLWMFSSKTLDSIPDLYEEINVVSVESVLPGFLVNTRFAGIPLFELLAVFVGMPLFYLFTGVLNRALSLLIGHWRRRLYGKPYLPDPQVLPRPIRILLLALVIRLLVSKLTLPLLARQFWVSTASILTIAGFVWLLILLNSLGEQYIRQRLRGRNNAGATSILRLARRAIDVLILFVGVLVTLYHFGVNPTAGLAGLGVGGIAVALAAQKTLENLIAGVSLVFDQAVSVGDILKVGDTLGTVDDIGLRSTRIRTMDRTMVSVPNGQIANLSLENFSSRDRCWFHPLLSLRCGTTATQMHAVLDSIGNLLKESPPVEHDSVRVRFLGFGRSSLDVEVFAYVTTNDWNKFLEIQEALLLRIMECIESAGTQIAIPSQTVFVAAASNSTDTGLSGVLRTPVQRNPRGKTTDPAAKSA